MSYTFSALSPADFEDLVRDLVGRDLHIRFEAFSTGPDGGIDGRHSKGGRSTILQAKHFVGSTFAALKAQMKRERSSIDRLVPTRYILTTSRALTPLNKAALASVIGPALKDEADIKGPDDLNTLLRLYPDIEKSHIKLWLSGTAVLERVLRSAAHAFNAITRSEIEAKVKLYAPNPSFSAARDALEARHVLIISGSPGVGKSTLAEMLSYAYTAEGWKLAAIRSLEDGLATIDDTRKQIFFFDDFLGKVALDRHALAHKDSELARFIRRVRSSPNARFILTTRAYIFEEARRVSEHLGDRRLNILKYVLDVGVYTRRIKARILYNHLLVSGPSQSHINALVQSGCVPKIVDHKHYNPRIIEWMTDALHVAEIPTDDYPTRFVHALDHPDDLWDIAFRNHISKPCQRLLITLFFTSQWGTDLSELRTAYNFLHRHLSSNYGDPYDLKDFEESVRILEGGFLTIAGTTVSFVNPSLRDYLTRYLDDPTLLKHIATAVRDTESAQALWRHARSLDLNKADLSALASTLMAIAQKFQSLPVWESADGASHIVGISNMNRIDLLMDWWEATRDHRFAELGLAQAKDPVGGLDSWRDGDEAIELIAKLRDGMYFDDFPLVDELTNALEDGLVEMLYSAASDDLERLLDAADHAGSFLGNNVKLALQEAIRREFSDVTEAVSSIYSQSTLQEHMESLEKLGKRATIPEREIQRAIGIVQDRMAEIEEHTSEAKPMSAGRGGGEDRDKFDNADLANLFAPLVRP
jgi:hypothetical protein